MKKLLYVPLLVIFLSGCATQEVEKTPVPIGGNKAGASVTMAYNYINGELPVVNNVKAEESATKVCNDWGYKKAKPFGGQTQKCTHTFNQYQLNGINYPQGFLSCYEQEVSIEYQCY